MNDNDHLPLVARPRVQIENQIQQYTRMIELFEAELDRRGNREEMRYGFPIPVSTALNRFEIRYKHFPTQQQAYDAAYQEFPEDREAAPYKVHPIYLGKDDA